MAAETFQCPGGPRAELERSGMLSSAPHGCQGTHAASTTSALSSEPFCAVQRVQAWMLQLSNPAGPWGAHSPAPTWPMFP